MCAAAVTKTADSNFGQALLIQMHIQVRQLTIKQVDDTKDGSNLAGSRHMSAA